MPSRYTVTIIPKLLTQGEHKGHLEYLHFTATAGDHQQRWMCVNTGTLSDDFRAIFGEWEAGILDASPQRRESEAAANLRAR
jgi:hypothetical protein